MLKKLYYGIGEFANVFTYLCEKHHNHSASSFANLRNR